MERYYKRAADIDQKIHSVKLPYLAWKVLFLIGEKQSIDDLAKILEEEKSSIENALSALLAEGLIEEWGGEEKEEASEEAAEETVEEVTEESPVSEEAPGQAESTEVVEEIIEEEIVEQVVVTQEPEEAEDEVGEEAEEEIQEIPEEPVSEILGEAAAEEITKEEATEKEIDEADFFAEEPDIVIGQKKEETEKAEETPEEKEESIFDMESELSEGSVFEDVETEESSEEKETIELTESEEQEETVSLDIDFESGKEEKEEVAEEAPAEEVPESQAPKRATDEKIILVIDDSIVIRKMVELALENEDYQIETAVTGKDGLKLLDQLEPDIVILDLMLPDINGIDLLKTIKASKGIPVIMLSGKDSPQTIEKARSEGADAFLPKPFRDEELVQTIKKLI